MDDEKIIPSIVFLLKSEMKKILLVDDDPVFQAVARKMIENCQLVDYIISSFRNGKEALDHLKQVTSSPDDSLVLLDLNMPVMNGMEMVDSIRRLEAYRNTPIFMLTTQAGKEIAKKGKEIGVTAWMVKPFKTDMLRKGLQRVLAA